MHELHQQSLRRIWGMQRVCLFRLKMTRVPLGGGEWWLLQVVVRWLHGDCWKREMHRVYWLSTAKGRYWADSLCRECVLHVSVKGRISLWWSRCDEVKSRKKWGWPPSSRVAVWTNGTRNWNELVACASWPTVLLAVPPPVQRVWSWQPWKWCKSPPKDSLSILGHTCPRKSPDDGSFPGSGFIFGTFLIPDVAMPLRLRRVVRLKLALLTSLVPTSAILTCWDKLLTNICRHAGHLTMYLWPV